MCGAPCRGRVMDVPFVDAEVRVEAVGDCVPKHLLAHPPHVRTTIPAPGGGGDLGMAWAEGTFWVGQNRDRKIHQVIRKLGAILRTIESNRFVTGVTWTRASSGTASAKATNDPRTGEVLEKLQMPPEAGVSRLDSDGGDQFLCGGGSGEKVRAFRRLRLGSGAANSTSQSETSPTAKPSPRARRRNG